MSKGNWNRNNDGFNFRPHSGFGQFNRNPRASRGANPSRGFQNATRGNYNQAPYYEDNRNYNNSYHPNFDSTQPPPVSVKDDETRSYAVNLQLKPFEMGIRARNGRWTQEFRGLGVFNHYFGLCAPTNNLGYTLADVWDGYFHITLAKFFSELTADQIEEVFEKFKPSLESIPFIPNIVFRTTRIDSYSGDNRTGGRKGIPFIVLAIDSSPQLKTFYDRIQSLLETIKGQARTTQWYVTGYNQLHVTVRKYSKMNFLLQKIKVQQFPLEFQCSHLEIRQPRELAMTRYNRGLNKRQWWSGVTEIDKKCSECGGFVMSDVWEGFCLHCGKYETVTPLWMTIGDQTHDRLSQQEPIQNNTISELVPKLASTNL